MLTEIISAGLFMSAIAFNKRTMGELNAASGSKDKGTYGGHEAPVGHWAPEVGGLGARGAVNELANARTKHTVPTHRKNVRRGTRALGRFLHWESPCARIRSPLLSLRSGEELIALGRSIVADTNRYRIRKGIKVSTAIHIFHVSFEL